MLNDIDEAAVYRLAAAVVKGLPADERAKWRETGHRIAARLARQNKRAAAKPGHMDTDLVETNSLTSIKICRRYSAQSAAKTTGRRGAAGPGT